MQLRNMSEGVHHKILDMSWSLAALPDLPGLAGAAVGLMNDIVGVDYLAFNRVDVSVHPIEASIYPREVRSIVSEEELSAVIEFHPAVGLFSSVGPRATPVRTSDIVPWREFVRTRAYDVLCKPHRLAHQMLVPVRCDPISGVATLYTLNRCRRPFSDEDLAIGYALQGVLLAHHSVRRLEVEGDDECEVDARIRLGLTHREAEVLALIDQGLPVSTIGRLLRLSPRTVQKHIENAYTALDVHDRMQAVAKCRRYGLMK